jgi:hypothetical protein
LPQLGSLILKIIYLPVYFKSGCIGNRYFLKYCGVSKYYKLRQTYPKESKFGDFVLYEWSLRTIISSTLKIADVLAISDIK